MGRTRPLGQLFKNVFGRTVWIFLDLVVPKPHYRPTLVFKESGALGIVTRCRLRMLAAVQLDREHGLSACQIDNIWSNRQLAREPWPIVSQPQPNQAFGLCGIIPQVPSILGQSRIDALHAVSLAKLASLATHP